MSSKKELKKENDELKEKLRLRETIIEGQRKQIVILRDELTKKRWQFWKY